MKFERKYIIYGDLIFNTAFHIGSGSMGDVSDSGVCKDIRGNPILPGSTIKGKFRTTIERLVSHIGLSACMLDNTISGEKCITGIIDKEERKQKVEEFEQLKFTSDRIKWLKDNLCDVCQLFGSMFNASRIFFSDGNLKIWAQVTEVRNGVVINRDSETAVNGLLYDYEVVPAGTTFGLEIEVMNPSEKDMAMVELGISEWERGVMIGGFTSRGLGRARLDKVVIEGVDFSDIEQRLTYLKEGKMTPLDRKVFNNALFSFVGGVRC